MMNTKIRSMCMAMALVVAAPLTVQAVPVTYDIGSGTQPGFSGSWIHAATSQMGSTGYYANGIAARISGSLTIDFDMGGNATSASGLLSGTGDFGLGSDTWTIDITGGSSSTAPTFIGGDSLLLSLDYTLTSASNVSSSGTFYFADRDFNNNTADGGPNLIAGNNLYLWGNNWINANGAGDRDAFVTTGGIDGRNTALGMDLFGTVRDVPEPGILALLAIGLIGIGVKRRALNA